MERALERSTIFEPGRSIIYVSSLFLLSKWAFTTFLLWWSYFTTLHRAQKIAEDAQRDLDEALPALEAATSSLKSLNTNDVVEVRAMQRPPDGVRLVIEAVCIMFEVKPKRVAGEKPGQKIDDFWEPGKGLLKEPPKFLKSLFDFDKARFQI